MDVSKIFTKRFTKKKNKKAYLILYKSHVLYNEGKGYYVGQIDDKYDLSGNGKLVLRDKNLIISYKDHLKILDYDFSKIKQYNYDGNFIDNKLHENGVESLIFDKDQVETFTGSFQNGYYKQGSKVFCDSSVYTGMFEYHYFNTNEYCNYNGQNVENLGKYVHWYGPYIESGWIKSVPHGYGVFSSRLEKEITKKLITFLDNLIYTKHKWIPNNYKALLETKEFYKGQFLCGKKHGFGFQINYRGEIYNGYFKDNLKHGDGEHHYLDGSVYNGKWDKNNKHGYGVLKLYSGKKMQQKYFNNKQIFQKSQDQNDILSLLEEKLISEEEYNKKVEDLLQLFTKERILSKSKKEYDNIYSQTQINEILSDLHKNPFDSLRQFALRQAYSDSNHFEFFEKVVDEAECKITKKKID